MARPDLVAAALTRIEAYAKPVLVTYHVYPPIPVRDYDWIAYVDGDEEAGRYGYGATEAEAIADFMDTYAEHYPGVEAPVNLLDAVREREAV